MHFSHQPTDSLDRTSLHSTGHAGVAEPLIAKDADINAKDKDNGNPLVLAKEKGREEIIVLLRTRRANE